MYERLRAVVESSRTNYLGEASDDLGRSMLHEAGASALTRSTPDGRGLARILDPSHTGPEAYADVLHELLAHPLAPEHPYADEGRHDAHGNPSLSHNMSDAIADWIDGMVGADNHSHPDGYELPNSSWRFNPDAEATEPTPASPGDGSSGSGG
jgi:hypothetical protein